MATTRALCTALRREPGLALALGWRVLLELRHALEAAGVELDVWDVERADPETAVAILVLGAWGVAAAAGARLRRKLHEAPYEFVAEMGEALHEMADDPGLEKGEVLAVIGVLSAYERHPETFMWRPAGTNEKGVVLCKAVVPIDVRTLVFDENQDAHAARALAETPAVACFLKMSDESAPVIRGWFLERVCVGAISFSAEAGARGACRPPDGITVHVKQLCAEDLAVFETPHRRMEGKTVTLLCSGVVRIEGAFATDPLLLLSAQNAACARVCVERNRNLRIVAAASAVIGWLERRAFETPSLSMADRWRLERALGYTLCAPIEGGPDELEAEAAHGQRARERAGLVAALAATAVPPQVGRLRFIPQPAVSFHGAVTARSLAANVGKIFVHPFPLAPPDGAASGPDARPDRRAAVVPRRISGIVHPSWDRGFASCAEAGNDDAALMAHVLASCGMRAADGPCKLEPNG